MLVPAPSRWTTSALGRSHQAPLEWRKPVSPVQPLHPVSTKRGTGRKQTKNSAVVSKDEESSAISFFWLLKENLWFIIHNEKKHVE